MVEHNVIIAGAGPAGCALALYLAQQGASVLLLEAQHELPMDLRASTFHPPSLDMLATLGVTQRLLKIGLVTPHYQYRDRRTGDRAVFDMSLLAGETDYPFRLQCEQYKMTRIVCEMLADYPNAEVRFNHRALKAENRGDHAELTASTPNGEQQLKARYIIGADGASSAVRKSLGVEFSGFTYSELFLVVSSPFPFEDVLPGLSNVNYVSDPDEWCVILRTPEIWRVLFPTQPGDSADKLLSDEFVYARLQHLTSRQGPFERPPSHALQRPSASREHLSRRSRAAHRRRRSHQ